MFFWAIPVFCSLFASTAAIFPLRPSEKTFWIKVKGSFVCNETDDYKVRVELWERETDRIGDNDDFISATEVMGGEKFSIEGSASKYGSVKPYFKLIHNCYDPRVEWERCPIVYLMNVPNGAVAGQPDSPQFEMEPVDLTDQLEYIDCTFRYKGRTTDEPLPKSTQKKETTTARPRRITQPLTTEATTRPVPQQKETTTPPLRETTEKVDATKSATTAIKDYGGYYFDPSDRPWTFPDY